MRILTRPVLFMAALCLAVGGTTLAADNPDKPSPAQPSVLSAPVSVAQPAAATCAAEAPAVASVTAPDEALEACSPPPQCWTDRDCDRICGKGNGQCVRVNSCYRECACASLVRAAAPRRSQGQKRPHRATMRTRTDD